MTELKIFNFFDELGLPFGIERFDDETNIELRKRIVERNVTNATSQGLLDSIVGIFNVTTKPVSDKKIFFSQYVPLSKAVYSLNYDINTYQEPIIKDGDDTYTIITSDLPDEEENYGEKYIDPKDVTNTINTKYWTLYKNIDGNYFPTWEASYAPGDVVLIYQTIIDNEVVLIEESAKKLTWEDGVIKEI